MSKRNRDKRETNRRTRDTHPIPDAAPGTGQRVADDLKRAGRVPAFIDHYGVAEWCPTPDGSGPPEMVVLHADVDIADIPFTLYLRFKSAGEVDRLIGMLTRHRLSVWPEVPQ